MQTPDSRLLRGLFGEVLKGGEEEPKPPTPAERIRAKLLSNSLRGAKPTTARGAPSAAGHTGAQPDDGKALARPQSLTATSSPHQGGG